MAANVNISEFLSLVGLDDLQGIKVQEIAEDFMPAAVAGLSDGDLAILHNDYTGRRSELYGEAFYNEGRVAQAVLKAALQNGLEPGPVYEFQSFAAEYMVQPSSPFMSQKVTSAIHIYPDNLVLDGNLLRLPRQPVTIIDYGACLSGRSYLHDQLLFASIQLLPFSYFPLTRLHFTNQTLINSYNADFGEGATKIFYDKSLYVGREDGVGPATNDMLVTQLAHEVPTEIADVILCTGTQHTTQESLRQGIVNAHQLMIEGGSLVVRSLARPASDEIGTDMVIGWAFEAGFDERNAATYETSLDLIGSLLLTGHFGDREIKTVVLTK